MAMKPDALNDPDAEASEQYYREVEEATMCVYLRNFLKRNGYNPDKWTDGALLSHVKQGFMPGAPDVSYRNGKFVQRVI